MKAELPRCAECERLRNLLRELRAALDGLQADAANAAYDLGKIAGYAKRLHGKCLK